ncbi:MAG TPA: DivIVA domain-containing protein [Marmoricola sp.]|jgi:DivIVA domain-containing protein|nr:DivIVA domain-containing protein [Marmoricola sp.]
MMWVLAVIVIFIIGGVFVVATSGGDPLSPSYDDRRDVLVPAEGPLSAGDLESIEFTTVVRGYRQSEVDALLDRLARQLAGEVPQAPATEAPVVEEPVVEEPVVEEPEPERETAGGTAPEQASEPVDPDGPTSDEQGRLDQ